MMIRTVISDMSSSISSRGMFYWTFQTLVFRSGGGQSFQNAQRYYHVLIDDSASICILVIFFFFRVLRSQAVLAKID